MSQISLTYVSEELTHSLKFFIIHHISLHSWPLNLAQGAMFLPCIWDMPPPNVGQLSSRCVGWSVRCLSWRLQSVKASQVHDRVYTTSFTTPTEGLRGFHQSLKIIPEYSLKLRHDRRSQWPRGLRHELSSLTRTLGSWVRIPLKSWMFVRVYSVFVLGSGLVTGWSSVQGVIPTV
jgi:hypothetical protein